MRRTASTAASFGAAALTSLTIVVTFSACDGDRFEAVSRDAAVERDAGAEPPPIVIDDGGGGGAGGSGDELDLDANVQAGDAAPSADAGPDAGDAGSPIPSSRFCGDAIRDPVLEECDDGPGDAEDSCSEACRARAYGVLTADDGAPEPRPRLLGTAPHVADGSEAGSAVVLVEDAREEARVLVQRFDAWGGRDGDALEVSAQAVAASVPNPALAALPGGDFAVAWTDLGAGSPDVALRVIDGAGGAGEMVIANSSAGGPQTDVDLIWTGEELVVTWTDLFDVYLRRFSAALAPRSQEQLVGDSAELESSVTLAPFAGDVAIAWRANDAGLDRIRVHAGGAEWWTAAERPSMAGDRPALAALDDQHLLLIYSIGEDRGDHLVSRLRVAVLGLDAPGEVTGSPLGALAEPGANDDALVQRRPRAARVGERVYVAWESEGTPGADASTVFVQQLDAEASGFAEVITVNEWGLPIEGPAGGDARNPALAASPLVPDGALIATWEDHAGVQTGRPVPDVMIGVRPSPIVTLP